MANTLPKPAGQGQLRVAPDRPTTQTVLVYSEVWNEFRVTNVESSIEGLSWSADPARRRPNWPADVKFGNELRLTLPADLPQGRLSDQLRIHIDTPRAPGGSYVHEVPLTGKVLRRLSVYGQGIDARGVVYVGPVDVGEGAEKKLLMKVRDPRRQLDIRKIETTPGFLLARVAPRKEPRPDLGLYELEIEIPADAPRCLYMGSPPGEVRILTDNPRFPELTLPVKFAVVARGS